MMMNDDNDDLESKEMDGLQSYARKGMAQELAKKLGLLGDVPGANTDAAAGGMDGSGKNADAVGMPDAAGDGSGDPAGADGGASGRPDGSGGDIPPELLMQILQSLGK